MKRTTWVASSLAVLLALGGGVGAGYANAATAAATVPDQNTAGTEQGQDGKHFGDRKGGFSAFGKLQDEIASYLGLELTELQTQLQEATLAEVALANGVSRENMKAKLVELIEAERAERASKAAAEEDDNADTSATDSADKKIQPLDSGALADKLLDAKGGFAGKGMNGGGHRGGFGHYANSQALTTLLGLTADELQSALKEGKTLAAIAAEQSIDVQAVIDLLVSEETARLDQALADGKITQAQYDEKKAGLTERVTKRVNETKPTGEPGGRGKHGGFDGRADKSTSETAESAAADA